MEPNRKSLGLPGPFGDWRFDFVALRTDGAAIRIRPSQADEAKLVDGVLSTWRLHEVRASTPGAAIAARDGAPTYDVLGRVDFVSNERAFARAMALHENAVAAGVDTSDPAWEHDLFGEDEFHKFPWDRWLVGRQWGKQLVSETVTTLTIGWRANAFRIRVTTRARPAPSYISLSASGSKLAR